MEKCKEAVWMVSSRKNLHSSRSTDLLAGSQQSPLAIYLVQSSTSIARRSQKQLKFSICVALESLAAQIALGLRRAVLRYHHEEEREDTKLRHSRSTMSLRIVAGGMDAVKCVLDNDSRQWTSHRHL